MWYMTTRVLTTVEGRFFCAQAFKLQHSVPGRKRSHKSSGSPQSASHSAGTAAEAAPHEIVKRFHNCLSGKLDIHTFATKGACRTVIMLDGYFIWTTHSLRIAKLFTCFPGLPSRPLPSYHMSLVLTSTASVPRAVSSSRGLIRKCCGNGTQAVASVGGSLMISSFVRAFLTVKKLYSPSVWSSVQFATMRRRCREQNI